MCNVNNTTHHNNTTTPTTKRPRLLAVILALALIFPLVLTACSEKHVDKDCIATDQPPTQEATLEPTQEAEPTQEVGIKDDTMDAILEDLESIEQCADESSLLQIVERLGRIYDTLKYEYEEDEEADKLTKIVARLYENPNITENVIKELENSLYGAFLCMKAQSSLADEETLFHLAQECHYIRATQLRNIWKRNIIDAIIKNDSTTGRVISKLSETNNLGMVYLIAENPLTSGEYLEIIAQKISLTPETGIIAIAEKIVDHKNSTSRAMEILAAAPFMELKMLVLQSTKTGEKALIELARFCVENDSPQLAAGIKVHPACTDKVLEVLSGAQSE